MTARMRAWLACGALLVLVGAASRVDAAGEYRTLDVESLRITVDSEWVPVAAPGYLPVRWDITNTGKERTIEIAGDGSRSFLRLRRFRQSRTAVRQRIHLGPGDRVRFTMNVPTGGQVDTVRFEIREDDRTIQALGITNTGRPYPMGGTSGNPSALIVVARGGSYAAAAPAWVRSLGAPGAYAFGPGGVVVGSPPGTAPSAPSGPPLDMTLEPDRLPDSWLGYTSVQAVVAGPREWDAMTATQREAVVTWIASGGTLVLVDAGLDTVFPDAQRRPAVTGNRADHFFGRIHLLTVAEIDDAGFDATMTSIAGSGLDRAWTLPLDAGALPVGTGGFRLPIPDVNAVPAGAYLTILVLFAVLIGPVNQLVLRKRGQQALIVLTTPIIAAVFIVLLGVYVVAGEGFAVRGRALSLTLLDQRSGQAVSRASLSLYAAGRAPSGGLRFARDQAVFPTPPDTAPPAGETLDLTETQQFSSGLLPARTPTNLETIAVRTARERLTFRREDGALRVSNGLGATIERLYVRDGDRAYELSGALAPGATMALRGSNTTPRALLAGGDSALVRYDPLLANVSTDSYVAVLDRSPFWDPGTSDLDERGSFHLVLGRHGGLP